MSDRYSRKITDRLSVGARNPGVLKMAPDHGAAIAEVREAAEREHITTCQFKTLEECQRPATMVVLIMGAETGYAAATVVCNRCFSFISLDAPKHGAYIVGESLHR